MRRTKIVATVGPASREPDRLRALIEAGVDVFRLNFSHGTHEDHEQTFAQIRTLSEKLARPVGILQDLQGPKIRLGHFDAPVTVRDGDTFELTTEAVEGSAQQASCDYDRLPSEVHSGDRILINDGRVELKVERVERDCVHTRVVVGGTLSSRKGVNLPGTVLSIPALTDKDIEDLAIGVKLGVDFIALSFVQRADDVQQCQQHIRELGAEIPVIAKIEKPQALDNLDDILEVSFGVMVARGDLGVEMQPEHVPVAQKKILREAERREKVAITATQMLESMRESPTPTRAEASDVANAIFDGTDAVMLSGETAMGKYPIESVKMMARICQEAERAMDETDEPWRRRGVVPDGAPFGIVIANAAAATAHQLEAKAVVAFTRSGATAVYVSKNVVGRPIVAFTPVKETLGRLALMRGVLPHSMQPIDHMSEMLADVDAALQNMGLVQNGDEIVIVAGGPVGQARPTNLMLVHQIGDLVPSP